MRGLDEEKTAQTIIIDGLRIYNFIDLELGRNRWYSIIRKTMNARLLFKP